MLCEEQFLGYYLFFPFFFWIPLKKIISWYSQKLPLDEERQLSMPEYIGYFPIAHYNGVMSTCRE